jgi:predicted ATPase
MGHDLPTGTVTFVFTDIAGSTRLLLELGDEAYAQALAEHRDALRTAFDRHDGVEVNTEGDAFFYAFPTARRALEASSDGLEALRGGPIRVRIGIHTGTGLLTDEGYVGVDVHRASRIASAGHGGQVLVSATTAALLSGDRFDLVDLGEHQLKDLARPERIFQFGSGSFPPLKSVSPSNLPVPATPFLGREEEVDSVRSLLTDDGVRVLTLTGPGGIGKTRLALQAAAESSTSFPDGLWWVSLSPLTDHRLVLSSLASVLGEEERPDVPLMNAVISQLRGSRSLVLLDNAEHLLPSLAIELAPLFRDAKGATFLVTSRSPLRVDAEYEFTVPGMSPADAERFIVARAAAVGARLEPSLAMADLCMRLDYLPLAMQLAAARLKLFSLEQLVDRLNDILDLPDRRDADPRQQTLRSTIEWSHTLLSPHEVTSFRRFAVFAGGATVQAAEEVTGADAATLFALLDHSLLRRREDASGPRLWMLETIREFANERLAQADEDESTRGRHAHFYLALAERAGVALEKAHGDWPKILDAELENLRAALSWFLERGDHGSAQRIAASLGVYWLDRGLLTEMRSWLDKSLSLGGPPGPAHAMALTRLSQVHYLQGDYEGARIAALRSYDEARSIGDPATIELSMTSLANALEAEGLLDEALDLQTEALRIAEELRSTRPRRVLVTLIAMGYAALFRGMYEDAVRYSEEAIALATELGEESEGGAARCNLAMSLIPLGRVDEAARLAAEATVKAIDFEDRLLGAACLEVLAACEVDWGQHPTAARLLGMSEAIQQAVGYELEPAERALHDRTVTSLRGVLLDREMSAAWSEGAALGFEKAFSLIGEELLLQS